ncbi:MAG: thioredoxin family protein [Kofleriaceae bacterium]
MGLVLVAACGTTDLQHATLPYAVQTAAEQDKPLIVELWATWCKPCKVFETHVLTDPRVQAALADVVFVRYDIDTPNGHDAMRRTREHGVPTVLGIDHEGTVRLRKVGTEPTADEFLNFMRQAHDKLRAQP